MKKFQQEWALRSDMRLNTMETPQLPCAKTLHQTTSAYRARRSACEEWSFGTLKEPKLQLSRRQTLNSSLAYRRPLLPLEPANLEGPLLTKVCKLRQLMAPISKLRQVQQILATKIEEPILTLSRRHVQLLTAQCELRLLKLVVSAISRQPLQPLQLAPERLSYRQAAPERAPLPARDRGFAWLSLQTCSTANTTQLNVNKMGGPLSPRRSYLPYDDLRHLLTKRSLPSLKSSSNRQGLLL